MAQLVHEPQKWQQAFGPTEFTVTLQRPDGQGGFELAPTVAGSTLVVYCAGGARVIEIRLGGSTGTLLALRTEALNQQSVSLQDIQPPTGTTTLWFKLNGAENVAGMIYEMTSVGAFIAASDNNAGQALSSSTDLQINTATAVALASGTGVLVAGWSTSATSASRPFNGINQWRGFGPVGRFYGNAGMQPGANTEFIWASGLADVTPTGRYPQTQAAGNYVATSQFINGDSASYAAQALYANADSVPVNPPANAVVAENSLPGTLQENWYPGPVSTNANICGYTNLCSYRPGETVEFKVHSTGNPFRVEVYRLGYYGWEAMAARNVLGNQSGYITGTPVTQPAPTVDATLGSVSCGWTTNATWAIPTGACPGVYLVLFRRTDVTTDFAMTHFVVGSGTPTGKAAMILPDFTYQAYNIWGAPGNKGPRADTWTGRSLYENGTGATLDPAGRAYAVSFDRPSSVQTTRENTYIFDSEFAEIVFAEAQGYNLDYYSNIDLHNDVNLLDDAALVALLGHQEYWTDEVYACLHNARDAGVNFFIGSGNTALWRVRFAPGDTLRRTMICYKDSLSVDVSPGFDAGTGRDPVSYTGTYRDNRVMNPQYRPENILTGMMFLQSAPSLLPHKVPASAKTYPIWRNSAGVQALTTGQFYTTPVGNLGDEVDIADGSATQPTNLVNLSPFTQEFTNCANANGTTYTATQTVTAGYIIYRADSGALVFNAGAWRAFWTVSRWRSGGGNAGTIDLNWQNAFLAIWYDLGQVPAKPRELRPAVDSAVTDPAIGAPAGTRDNIAAAYGLEVPGTGQANFFLMFAGA